MGLELGDRSRLRRVFLGGVFGGAAVALLAACGGTPATTPAGGVLMSLPVLLLYFFAQRYIVAGLAAGAVKG
jgi:ABC-type glycerol-3-phosphate transport system permease component